MSSRPVLLVIGLAVAGSSALLTQAVAANTIVCWTDAQGRRACGDRVPPEYARQERQVYDASGRVVETLPRQKTPEEVAEEQRRAADLEERRRRATEQAAYDRFLLTTFTSVAELEKTRDMRLGTLASRLELAEESQEQNRKGIEQLKAQIADFEAQERKVPTRLTRQLQEIEQNLASNLQVIDKLKLEHGGIRRKFDEDIERYRFLTGASDPAPEPDPEPEVEG